MKNSEIAWTDHTFNPWWGCTRMSPGCDFCYAESMAKRWGHDIWGPRNDRRFFGDKHWAEPLRWNDDALRGHSRSRVFCASMSDVFEDRRELDSQRARLWPLIEQTQALDWLLLTKRPQNIKRMAPWGKNWPENVWIGTTVENDTWANHRIPELMAIPAAVRFLSCEPLIGPVDLRSWFQMKRLPGQHPIDWVIAGGESGPKARPMHPDWARDLRDACTESDVAFHFKQWGEWGQHEGGEIPEKHIEFVDRNGKPIYMVRKGKKAGGRSLDGREWDEVPSPQVAVP